MEIKILSLEDKLKVFRKQSKEEQNREIFDCMLLGYSPYNMCLEIGLNVYGGQRPISKSLAKEFNPKQVDEIFETYYRLLYFPLLRFEEGLMTKRFINRCDDFLKNLTYQNFINYLKDPAIIISEHLIDTDILARFFSKEMQQKQIKYVEAELGIEFNIRDKITSWLRKANVMYYKGKYIDIKTQEPLTFSYE
ncbi:MAG: hypothetical protein Q4A90_06635 [Streptococcus sp.]|nr:hypothetical protein [Streptococcus sp.]